MPAQLCSVELVQHLLAQCASSQHTKAIAQAAIDRGAEQMAAADSVQSHRSAGSCANLQQDQLPRRKLEKGRTL